MYLHIQRKGEGLNQPNIIISPVQRILFHFLVAEITQNLRLEILFAICFLSNQTL